MDHEVFHRPLKQLGERKPAFVDGDLPVREVVLAMKSRDEPCVLVGSADHVAGIFTERDLLSHVANKKKDVLDAPVSELMTAAPKMLSVTDSIEDALQAMAAGGYRHLPVTEESDDGLRVIGVVSVSDIVDFLVIHFPDAILNPWFDIKPGDSYG